MNGDSRPKMTLHAEMRSVARTRIIRAARAVLVRQGLQSTVEDVASEGGVSRRTVFRHFPTHGELLAAAITEMIDDFQAVVAALPMDETNLEGWLVELGTRLHTFQAEEMGETFWDLYADRSGLPPELATVLDQRLGTRFDLAESVAQQAWQAVGGRGPAASWVVDAFLLQLSGFAYHGFQVAGETRTPTETARVSATVLSAVLQRALQDQAEARPRSSR